MAEPGTPDRALDGLRTSVTSDDGLVTAVVDGAGDLVELAFDPKAMRRDAAGLAETVRRTVSAALDTARAAAAERLRLVVPPMPDSQQLLGVLEDMQSTAASKLSQMSAALEQLLDRPEGTPR